MKSGAFISFLLVALIFGCFLQPVLEHPNGRLFANSSDGIKAYAVCIGHINNDTTYLNYENMNYPYGQSFIYTDGQFIFTNTLKFLSKPFPFFSKYAIGIFNLLIFLSYPLCAFFLTLIFRRLNLPGLYSILASCAITMMAPQLFRISGHITLPYAVCIPMSWYFMIRFFEEGKWKYSLLITFLNTFWFFVHPYYQAILVLFNLIFFAFFALKSDKSGKLTKALHFFLQIALPLLIAKIFLALVDHHTGRPETPVGFWLSIASWQSVFFPVGNPFKEFFNFYVDLQNQNWEGYAFVGIPSAVLVIFIFIRWIRYILHGDLKRVFYVSGENWLGFSMIAATIVLCYSMCIPFKWNLDFVVERISVLKQFRALGRFAWVFYFVYSVYSYQIFYKMYKALKLRKATLMAGTFLTLIFTFNFAYGYVQISQATEKALDNQNQFNKAQLSESMAQLVRSVDSLKKDYQCLLPLPFFHVGSDNFQSNEAPGIINTSFVVSYHCNFPMMASSSARSPVPEAKKLMAILGPPFFKKDIEKDIDLKKPILILATNEEMNADELYWFRRSQLLWNNTDYMLLSLNPADLFNSQTDSVWSEFDSVYDSLICQEPGFLVTKAGYLYYNSTDLATTDTSVFGSGSLRGRKNRYSILMKDFKTGMNEGTDYILSFWYYNAGDLISEGDFVISETDSLTGKIKWICMKSPMRTNKINGNWSLVEMNFKISSGSKLISLFFPEIEHNYKEYYADEFLIREAGTDVYRVLDVDKNGKVKAIFKNNFTFVRPDSGSATRAEHTK